MLAGGEKSRIDTRMTAMLPAKMRDGRSAFDVKLGDLFPPECCWRSSLPIF